MQASKKVIIFDKLNSTRITQAIFILSDDADADFSAVDEAERLVEKFLGGAPLLKKRRRAPKFLMALLAVGIAAIAAILLFYIS